MKTKRVGIAIGFLLSLFAVVTSGAYASHQSAILGYSTQFVKVELPPTIGGPGFLLPDSPFFALDQLKQKIRLALSITAEQRALAYTEVANERLAELRFMASRGDTKGIRIAFEGIYDNFESAADELNEARLRGKDVSATAKKIVNIMREHQKVLDILDMQATGVLKKQVAVTQESILLSKLKTEDGLKAEDLADEVRYDFDRKNASVVLGERSAQ